MPQPVEHAKKIDALADRFEKEWKAGRKVRIEQLLTQADASVRSELLQVLVEVEIELRRQKGDQPSVAEYRARFPQEARAVQTAFDSPSKRGKAAASQDTSVSQESVRTGTFSGKAPAAPPQVKVPAMIGRFHVEALLGSGGFGRVYRARDPELDRLVAIKVPLPNKLESDDDIERFLREARSAATLQHPNICPVHEVNRAEGVPYIVMSYVDGKSLADQIAERKTPLPVKQAILIVRKVATALAAAHAKGIIHRDLKPANIMIDRERKDVIVMDFGLARRVAAQDEANITQSGMIMGTPAYMSPEQARGDAKKVGPASDIYSLGVVLYELVTGKRPFTGSMAEVLSHVLHTNPDLPSDHRKDLDRRIDAICVKALAKDPAQRFASMKEFADALGECLKEASPASIAKPSPSKTLKKDEGESTGFVAALRALSDEHREEAKVAIADAVRRSRAPRWQILVGLGLLGLILLGTVIILFTRSGDVYVQVVLNTKLDERLLKDGTIRFVLDNTELTVEDLQRPIELKTGKHTLIAWRGKDEVQRYVFVVSQSADGKKANIDIEDKTPYMPPPVEDPNPWIELFNGKDLTGWKTQQPNRWKVENGLLTSVPGEKPHRLLTERGDYGDVHVRAECRVRTGGGGIGIRVRPPDKGLLGFKVRFSIDEPSDKKNLRTDVSVTADKWMIVEMIVRGHHCAVKVDGREIGDYEDADKTQETGHLSVFAGGATQIEFRKIGVKELKPEPKGDFGPLVFEHSLSKADALDQFHVSWGWHAKAEVVPGTGLKVFTGNTPPMVWAKPYLGDRYRVQFDVQFDQRGGARWILNGPGYGNNLNTGYLCTFNNTTFYFDRKEEGTKVSKLPKAIASGEWTTVQTDFDRGKIAVTINGQRVFDFSDPEPLTGPLNGWFSLTSGIVAGNGAEMVYRNLRIWSTATNTALPRQLTSPAPDKPLANGKLLYELKVGAGKVLPKEWHAQPTSGPVENGTVTLSEGKAPHTVILDQPLSGELACEVEFEYPTPDVYNFNIMLWFAKKAPKAAKDCDAGWVVALPLSDGRSTVWWHNGPKHVHDFGGFFTAAPILRATPNYCPIAGRKYVARIETVGDRLRVFLNGGLVLTAKRPADATTPASPVFLGLRQYFSTTKVHAVRVYQISLEGAGGFMSLFNGKDLTGWKTLPEDKARWEVKDGILTGSGPVGHLYTDRADFANFHLRAEVRINDGGNSGMYFRTAPSPGFPKGYEAQINSTHKDPIKTGSLFPVFDPALTIDQKKRIVVKEMLVKPGEWFTQEVIAQGNRIIIKVNDKTTVDFIDEKNTYSKGQLALQQHHDGSVVEFRRIEVKELPASQEAGFVPLFNGKDLTGWKTHPQKPGQWRVENGALVGSGDQLFRLLFSERGDYTNVHVRVEAQINAQGNSGLHLRSPFSPDASTGYEAQIAGPNLGIKTGSLFIKGGVPSVKVNQDLVQADTWFTLEHIVVENRIIILVNGKVVVDHTDKEGTWKQGHIALEMHDPKTTVRFRKVEVRELKPGDPLPVAEDPEVGFVPLFNGKDLTGWAGITNQWRVEGGAIVGEVPPEGLPKNLFLSPNLPFPLKDFELRLEAKMIKGNSGIQVRSKRVDDKVFTTMVGPQIEIAHNAKWPWSSLVTEPSAEPSLVAPKAQVDKLLKPADFNEMIIRCVGKHITIALNGTVTVDADFPTMPEEGLIGLQIHKTQPGMRVEFRNIRLKELKSGNAQAPSGPTEAESQAIAAVFKLGGQVALVQNERFMEASKPAELPSPPYSLFGVNLTHRPAQDAELAVLAGLPRLKDVALGGTKVTDAGLAHLANVPKLGGLWLDDTAVTGSGFRFLDKADNLAVLYLNGTKINNASLQALGRRPKLAELYMSRTSIGDEALKYVANFPGLGQLGLSGTKITNAGLAHLKGHPTLLNLFLANTAITDDGLVHLQDLGRAAKDGLLVLSDTKITDKGLAHLSGLTWLQQLDLAGTAVNDEGLIHLQKLTQLSFLKLARTKVSPAGVADLRKALPKCNIVQGQ